MATDPGNKKQRHYTALRWIGIPLLMTALLFGYDLTLGIRFWMASAQIRTLNSPQPREASDSLQTVAVAVERLKGDIGAQEQRASVVQARYGSTGSDYLVDILATTAAQHSLHLGAMTVGDTQLKREKDLQLYQRSILVILKGNLTDIFDFLTSLQARVPGTAISTIRISDVSRTSSSQIQLLFSAPVIASSKDGVR